MQSCFAAQPLATVRACFGDFDLDGASQWHVLVAAGGATVQIFSAA
jgi:hypothetical protein